MESDALKAVAALNHHKLNGKVIDVSIARPKSTLPDELQTPLSCTNLRCFFITYNTND